MKKKKKKKIKKVERISLLLELARIHRKMEKYFCIPAEIWLLHLSVNSPKSPYTSLKLDQLRVFYKLFRVDDKGLALQSNCIKMFPVESQSTLWIIIRKKKKKKKKKKDRITPQNVYL